jgi:hypothetical protein
MYCSRCGSPNIDGARFCEKCGMGLPGAAPVETAAGAAAAPAPQPPPVYTDPRVRGAAPYSVPGPGGKVYATGKNPAVALLLSFFLPAVGQFYNGDAKKGGLILAGYFVSLILAGFGVGFVTGLGLWIYSCIDAYRVASGAAPLAA